MGCSYIYDVEKSLLFYEKIIVLKLSIQMDMSSELRIKKVNMKNVYLFFMEIFKKMNLFLGSSV